MASLSSTPRKTRPSRLRWLRRALVALLVLANLAVFAVYWTLRSAQKALTENATKDTDVVSELVPPSTAPPATSPGGSAVDGTTDGTTVAMPNRLTFLVIGSDSRAGVQGQPHFGTLSGSRADVIMLVQIFPDQGRAQVLSIPRDLWVPIDGHDHNRINAAYAFGGTSLMTKTVRQVTGIDINHYVEVDFVGFEAIVNQLGGVTIDFPNRARDLYSGLSEPAGSQHLNGSEALAYARSRHYQELRNGRWVSVDASDIGRTHRQQQLILAIVSEMKRPANLVDAGAIVKAFASHLTIDATLADEPLLQLAFKMRNLSASSIETATLPTTPATIGGRSVLRARQPQADAILAAFRAGTTLQVSAPAATQLAASGGAG